MKHALVLIPLVFAITSCGRQSGVREPAEQFARFDWWDNQDTEWFAERIPLFESPDSLIDAAYYYRWEVLTKHLVYGSPESGYTFTEFIDRPFWSGRYGAISCPLGHQHYEVRWLADRRIVDDFARYWFETPGAEPRSYSNWYGDAMWATYAVTRDDAFLARVYPHMVAQYEGWMAERWDPEHRMFAWNGMRDGMETNINSRQTPEWFDGAEGYRPTLNSYLFGDLMALSKAAGVLGDWGTAGAWRQLADSLKARVLTELWDPEREFFFHQFARDEAGGIAAKSLTYQTGPYAESGRGHGREAIGFVPWQFHLPPAGYEAAWKYLMDPDYFYSEYGPTTTEQGDPLFKVSPRCCEWSGNSWPYATTQTLVALANLLNDYEQDEVDASDFAALMGVYARTQRKDGRPYVAEAADPYTGSWEGHDTYYHSEHYLHSGFVDLVISGLAGLRPRADDVLEVNPLIPEDWDWFSLDRITYHGHRVSILWDRDGSRYGRGAGLSLFVDGKWAASRRDIGRLTAVMPPPPDYAPVDRPVNFAVNNERSEYPLITASFAAPGTPAWNLNDGAYWYHITPPNRWTTEGSLSDTAWVQLDFGAPRPVDLLKLYFLDDGAGGALPPAGLSVSGRQEGAWSTLYWSGSVPAGRRAVTIPLDGPPVDALRFSLQAQPGASTGMSEIEAWGEASGSLEAGSGPRHNLAFNPGEEAFPALTSSVSSGGDLGVLNDSESFFTSYSGNRWIAAGSGKPIEWVQVDLGTEQSIGAVEAHFISNGSTIQPPAAWWVETATATGWRRAPELGRLPSGDPLGMAVNRIDLMPVNARRLRLVFRHATGAGTGLTEIVVLKAAGP